MDRELFESYLRDTSRRGPAVDGAFTGAAGGTACGDLARISFLVEDGRLISVSCDAEGCGATIAATSAVAEAIEGAEVLEAARLSIDDVEALLGGLTPAKRHAAQLAADALHRGLSAAAASSLPLTPASTRGEIATTPAAVGRNFPPGPTSQSTATPDRVAVAMSGGVDSAVAALLERERGNEVIAVTVKLWADPETDGTKACCSPEAVLGARELAHQLGMPHFTLDLEQDFRRRVVGRFVSGYAEGKTPNPCILCNGEVRLAAMIDLGDRLGASRLLTGHYARIVEDEDGPLLAAGADPAKDQSYMLAALPPKLLGRLGFPLTELTKPEVRAIAERHQLAVAKKAESQDLCFLAGQGKRGFLRRHGGLEDREGAVLDSSGHTLGRHPGHHNFTVGQRRGTGVSLNEPAYVIATDAVANTVTVGTRSELVTHHVHVRDAVLHREGARVDAVRLRYRSKPLPASIGSAGPGRHEALEVELGEEFAGASPGQTAVLLEGETIVGHGTIASAV
jgi:tRNA-uridine 2-sulfurtransferase